MPESDYQISAVSAGASAATAMLNQEVTEPIEVNAVSATSTAATSTTVAPDVQKNGVSIFGTVIGNVFQGQTAQGSAGGITSTTSTAFDFLPSGKPVEANSLITIDTEVMLVTGVAGSPTQSPGGVGVQRLTVTRGAQGTTAATHASNAQVTLAKPQIASGGTATPTNQINLAVPVAFAVSDVLDIIGATGATGLEVLLDVIRV